MPSVGAVVLVLSLTPALARSEPQEACPSFYEDRIVTPEEVKAGSVPASAKPLWVLGWPCRHRIGRYWFSVVSPLEGFELVRGEGAFWKLRFRDLALERGYTDSKERGYRFETRDPARLERVAQGETAGEISLELAPSLPGMPPDRFGRSPRLVVDVFALPEALPVRVIIGNGLRGPRSEGPGVAARSSLSACRSRPRSSSPRSAPTIAITSRRSGSSSSVSGSSSSYSPSACVARCRTRSSLSSVASRSKGSASGPSFESASTAR